MDAISANHMILNHCRIMQLLAIAGKHLHRIFHERWAILHKLNGQNICEWSDGEKCGLKLAKMCATALKNVKELMKNGKVDLWDITLTCAAIRGVTHEIKKFKGKIDEREDVIIECIRNTRNIFSHRTDIYLSDHDFDAYWKQLSGFLVHLGSEISEIDDVKNEWQKFELTKVEEKPPKFDAKFKKLKEKGNNFFKNNKFKDAIKIYDQILNICGLSVEDQSIIFSNRSAAYLMLKDEISIKMAKRDADWAIQLRPCWWRGYQRLARVQMETHQWVKAEKSLETTLALNSAIKEARDDLNFVKMKQISQEDHLHPFYRPESEDEYLKNLSLNTGLSTDSIKNGIKNCSNIPGYGHQLKAMKYKQGWGVPQNLEKAFENFAIAAEMGYGGAMLNLAIAYDDGLGVEKNPEKALFWYLKVAEGKSHNDIRNVPEAQQGFAEAQYNLAVKYHMGNGVVKDIEKAVHWYKKAADNGFVAALYNLGTLYFYGNGVEKSQTKAVQYFKMAAQKGETVGMLSLADCYFNAAGTGSITPTKEDIDEGIKWLEIAAKKGDLKAARMLEEKREELQDRIGRFIFLESENVNNPLDFEQYGKSIKEAAKAGSVTAQRHLDIWKCLNIATDCYKRNNAAGVVEALAKAIRLHSEIVKIADFFKPVIEERYKNFPNELNTIVCYIHLKSTGAVELLATASKMFPEDEFLALMRHCAFETEKDAKGAMDNAKEALKHNPKSLSMLFIHAVAVEMEKGACDDTIETWNQLLAILPNDDDKIPAIHYRKAALFCSLNDTPNFLSSFKTGVAAEKLQLPCFLPNKCDQKSIYEKVYEIYNKGIESAKPADSTNLPPMEKLGQRSLEQLRSDPQRRAAIIHHRASLIKNAYFDMDSKIVDTLVRPTKTPLPPSLVSLKSFTLKNIDQSEDKVYNGYVLEGRIIDFAYVSNGIHTIIEDENGDTLKIAIYKSLSTSKTSRKEQIREAVKTFRTNVLISIINPYILQDMNNRPYIRVENPSYFLISR
uniref:DZIP3-like HEPN domain-containing protein n=1 Tax=Panagrolaimus sp. ES5 TaxID=591445 RepID=A0AC34F8N3_9BILA